MGIVMTIQSRLAAQQIVERVMENLQDKIARAIEGYQS